jgi:hypothetical protein
LKIGHFWEKKPQMSVFFCNFKIFESLKKCLLPGVLTNCVFGLGFFRALQKLQKKNVHFSGHENFVTIYDNKPPYRPNPFSLQYKNISPRERFSGKK